MSSARRGDVVYDPGSRDGRRVMGHDLSSLLSRNGNPNCPVPKPTTYMQYMQPGMKFDSLRMPSFAVESPGQDGSNN